MNEVGTQSRKVEKTSKSTFPGSKSSSEITEYISASPCVERNSTEHGSDHFVTGPSGVNQKQKAR